MQKTLVALFFALINASVNAAHSCWLKAAVRVIRTKQAPIVGEWRRKRSLDASNGPAVGAPDHTSNINCSTAVAGHRAQYRQHQHSIAAAAVAARRPVAAAARHPAAAAAAAAVAAVRRPAAAAALEPRCVMI